MPPTRKLTDVPSPVRVRTIYQLVVGASTPYARGLFDEVVPKPAGWNLALSWMVTMMVLGVVVALIT